MKFFKATTIAEAQNRADALRHAAKLLGAPVPSNSAAQQLIAKENGYANWSAFKADQANRVDQLLKEVELSHARCSTTEAGTPISYGQEHAIAVGNGFSIKFQCDDGGVLSHARITDPLGREVLYYVSDEFEEAPLEVVRALLSCASRGNTTAPTTEQSVKPPMGSQLEALSGVVLDGQYFHVHSCEPEVTDPDEVALRLQYDDGEGLLTDVDVTLEQLQELTWNASKGEFIAPDGSTFTFYRNIAVTGNML